MRFAPRSIYCRLILASLCGIAGASGCRPSASASKATATTTAAPKFGDDGVAPDALLDSAVQLLQSNKRSPAGHLIAAQRLNQYLVKSRASGQALLEPLSAEVERALARTLTPEQLQRIKAEQFDRSDSPHMEACFSRRDIVTHVTAGTRDDLQKVLALFDWVIRNVQIVGPEQAAPIPLTPALTLILGRGTYEERAWTFMELLRQIEIDSVMLAHMEKDGAENRSVLVPLLPAVLLDDSLYLFDTTLGLPVPGPQGNGVATLRQVQVNPELLQQLDLDPTQPYRIRPDQMNKVVVLLESTPDYWSPRMRFLQDRLSGEKRAILWSDFSSVYARLRRATSEQTEFDFWPMPNAVDQQSRTQAYSDQLTGSRDQLIGLLTAYQFFGGFEARLAQLHGRWKDAIPVYMSNRVSFPEWAQQERNQLGLRAIAASVSKNEKPTEDALKEVTARVTDLYSGIREDSTYFLGVAKFEQHEYEPAANWMGKSYLEKYPDGRWTTSALYHLGRCAEVQQDIEKAIECYTKDRTSPQAYGNLIRARQLGWTPTPTESEVTDTPASSENPANSSR